MTRQGPDTIYEATPTAKRLLAQRPHSIVFGALLSMPDAPTFPVSKRVQLYSWQLNQHQPRLHDCCSFLADLRFPFRVSYLADGRNSQATGIEDTRPLLGEDQV